MKKKVTTCIIIFALIISNLTNIDVVIGKNSVPEDSLQYVMTDKPITELEPGEETTSVLGWVVTCCGEETKKNEQSSDKYATTETNSFVQGEFCENSVNVGAILDEQMRNYLDDSSGKKATVTTSTDADEIANGELTKVKFDLSSYNFYLDDYLMVWVMDAISMYPSLSTLHTHISYSYMNTSKGNKLSSLTVSCSVLEKDIKQRTAQYEKQLAKLIEVPLTETAMSDAEKILYIHDRIVNIGDYVNGNDILCHTPAAILLDSQGVCQSYANVFNHAMVKLGIESVMVCSSTHAWNAVRLDGKWYYVDVTWGDPIISGTSKRRSYVSHEYILVQENDFDRDHSLDSDYSDIYGAITSGFGNAYDSFLPMDNITRGMWYSKGNWYFGNGSNVSCWNPKTNLISTVSGIKKNGDINVVEVNEDIYYSNLDGLYLYSAGSSEKLINGEISDMYLVRNVICYEIGSATYEYIVEEEPTPTPKPTATPTPEPTATPMPQPTEGPQVTDTPQPTEEPQVTDTPQPTEGPQVTDAPQPTEGPQVTDAPQPTEGPQVTDVPQPTEGPQPTMTPVPGPASTPTIIYPFVPTPQPLVQSPAVQPTYSPGEGGKNTEEPIVFDLSTKAKINKILNVKKRKVKITIKKTENAAMYQVMYHTKKSFKNAKSLYSKKTKVTLKKLKLKKTYYIKVRACFNSGNSIVAGKWSSVKKIKVKK